MPDIETAQFRFINYKISEFSFKASEGKNVEMNINLSPSGEYNIKDGVYKLYIIIKCTVADTSNDYINIKMSADFQFKEAIPVDKIPPFFYQNSIAIVFPYIRAFISTLTLQSNAGLVAIPIANLTGLETTLKSNTKVKES